jgi:hypothetical protein
LANQEPIALANQEPIALANEEPIALANEEPIPAADYQSLAKFALQAFNSITPHACFTKVQNVWQNHRIQSITIRASNKCLHKFAKIEPKCTVCPESSRRAIEGFGKITMARKNRQNSFNRRVDTIKTSHW